MITGERLMAGGEPPPRISAAGAESLQRPAAIHPWHRRVSFWRAVAGMTLAVALGYGALLLGIVAELSSSSAHLHSRLELQAAELARLRNEAANAEQQLAEIHAERRARDQVNRVLSAPDVRVLRLMAGKGSKARGLAAISRQEGGAVIELAGMAPLAGGTGVMWWLPAQGAPAKAAELAPGADGRLSLAIAMPPRGARIAGAIITLEFGKPRDKPYGKIMLKGVLPRPQVLS
jgi:hypothetical protein